MFYNGQTIEKIKHENKGTMNKKLYLLFTIQRRSQNRFRKLSNSSKHRTSLLITIHERLIYDQCHIINFAASQNKKLNLKMVEAIQIDGEPSNVKKTDIKEQKHGSI